MDSKTLTLENVLQIEDPCGLTYYLGTLQPAQIKQLTFVPVVAETQVPPEAKALLLNEQPGGYQRAGDSGRMEEIRKFIQNRPRCVIPPVLLCARGKWKFQPTKPGQPFGRLIAQELAAIIDGQHRLGGLWRLVNNEEPPDDAKNRLVPFMLINEMSEEEEKREFVDINDNQKGVKKSLLKYLEREKSFRGQAALALMEDEESVFKGRIDIQKKHDWTLLLFGAVTECIDLMYNSQFTKPHDFAPEKDETLREGALEITLKYWRSVQNCLPEYWADMNLMPAVGQKRTKDKPGTRAFDYRLLEETGIRAFSKLASELFSKTWVGSIQQPSWEALEKHLRSLAENERLRLVLSKPKGEIKDKVLEVDADLRSTGKAGVEAIFRHLKAALDKAHGGGSGSL